MTIRFVGLRGRRTLKHRRIDAQRCSACKKRLEPGSPAMPDFSQREIMDEAGGDYALTVTMTQNAVSLIELIFVGQSCKSCRQAHDSSFFCTLYALSPASRLFMTAGSSANSPAISARARGKAAQGT